MARTLFGTDGIRGVAGEYPLDGKTANAVGIALGKWVLQSNQERRVVIGMDTRESGPWIAAEVAGGLAIQGVSVNFAGITTTPGVAYLAKNGPFAAGVMISASHNPYRDNGIKLIGHSGYKLPDEQEEILETEIFALRDDAESAPAHAEGRYRAWIARTSIIWPATLPQAAGRVADRRATAPTVPLRRWRRSFSNAWVPTSDRSTALRTAATST